MVRPATLTDLKPIVRVHQSAFAGFFMTLLGPGFLAAYYRTAIEYSGGLCMVVEDDGVQGFVVGFKEPSRFYSSLRQRKWSLAVAAVSYVAWRPQLWSRLLNNARRVDGAVAQNGQDTDLVELSSIGVSLESGRRGYGKQLVLGFLKRAAELGVKRVVLTTDAVNNEQVNAFYRGLGFTLSNRFSTGSRAMNEYEYLLSDLEPSL
jgi:ribosomal protein S18 acetylase RimI-like enzyme